MRVLQFGMGDDIGTSMHAPHNFPQNCVCYIGTHDNNTALGWYDEEVNKESKERISDYAGFNVERGNLSRTLLNLIFKSPAKIAMPTMQDILELDSNARMNIPGKGDGNWGWKMPEDYFKSLTVENLRLLTEVNGRL